MRKPEESKKKADEERISQRILYVLISISAVVFLAFYLIGFSEPFAADSTFNSPLLTDVLIGFMWLLLMVAISTALVAIIRSIRMGGKGERLINGIPVRRIGYVVSGITIISLILTFLLGSSEGMTVNGQSFTDAFWLRVSDMFVSSSLILLAVAVGAVVFGATRYYRKERKQ
ncbi:MAG: hypothetical protein K6A82_03125 [Prevotella sp.]|nr:hypothetical protein [Prevotella sp.]